MQENFYQLAPSIPIRARMKSEERNSQERRQHVFPVSQHGHIWDGTGHQVMTQLH